MIYAIKALTAAVRILQGYSVRNGWRAIKDHVARRSHHQQLQLPFGLRRQ
jgi:hypothetical protein